MSAIRPWLVLVTLPLLQACTGRAIGLGGRAPGDRAQNVAEGGDSDAECAACGCPGDASPSVAPVITSFVGTPSVVPLGLASNGEELLSDVTFRWTYAEPPEPTPTCDISPANLPPSDGVVSGVSLSAHGGESFSVTCANDAGGDRALTVVGGSPVAPRLGRFSASPADVEAGVPTSITWTWAYAGSPTPAPTCSIDNNVGEAAPGIATVVSLTTDTRFTLTCSNDAGTESTSVLVRAGPPAAPQLAAFSASPDLLGTGATTEVLWRWAYANTPVPAPTCNIDHGVGQVRSGDVSQVQIDADTIFTLDCTNTQGTDSTTFTIPAVPTPSPPLQRFRAVSSGDGATCAIGMDGHVECWGDAGSALIPPQGTFVAVSVGSGYVCGIRDDHTLVCWGNTPQDTSQAVLSPPSGQFTAVTAGDVHACAIRMDNTVACWGSFYGSTAPPGRFLAVSAGADFTCAVRNDETLQCWGANAQGQAEPPTGLFAAVSAGNGYACGLRLDHSLACWGTDTPDRDSLSGQFVSMSARGEGPDGLCAIRCDHSMRCWTQTPHPPGRFASVSVGSVESCALTTQGTLVCWGPDRWRTPTHGTNFALTVSTGTATVCGIGRDNALLSWGFFNDHRTAYGRYVDCISGSYYHFGILDDDSLKCWNCSYDRFQSDPPSGGFVQLSTAYNGFLVSDGPVEPLTHTCALRTDNTLACWGGLSNGPSPPLEGTFIAVALGYGFGCALENDRTVACWSDDPPTPPIPALGQATPPAGHFVALSAGGMHACAIRDDGSVACWGDDRAGESTPPAGSFSAVAAGFAHTCGIRSDGAVLCWGDNTYGQATPPADEFLAISARDDDTCGITTAGEERCWGEDWLR